MFIFASISALIFARISASIAALRSASAFALTSASISARILASIATRSFASFSASTLAAASASISARILASILDTREIIHWVEEQTNLTFNKQFHLVEVEKGRLYFKSCLNGQEVSPFGDIELKYDYDGRIIFFSVNGHFPNLDLQVKEDYTLSLEKIDELKRAQLKLIDYPSAIYKKLIEIYAVEEIYIKNDLSTIPYEVSLIGKEHLKIDKIITWESRLSDQFERKEIAIIEEIPEELAFSGESHPDLIPISEQEREKCEIAVTNFLRQQYPFDSGNWKLSELCRDKGYIHAILAGSEKKSCVLQRKLLLRLGRLRSADGELRHQEQDPSGEGDREERQPLPPAAPAHRLLL